MAENQIMEIISAYAAGCLDRENFIQFKEYYNSGGELPLKDLGELQNTMALVPIILEPEEPRKALKAEIAKKLMALQDEIKEKIIEQKRKASVARKIEEEKRIAPEPKEEPHFEQVTPTLDTREVFEARKIKDERITEKEPEVSTRQERVRKEPTREEKQKVERTKEEVEYQKKEKSFLSSKLPWILAITFLIVAVAFYFLFTGKIDSLNEQLTTQNKQIKQLQKDLALNKKMVTDYKELLKFFQEKSIYVVELAGGEKYPNSSGRLFISFHSGDGILILQNPPQLKEDEAYQLWMITEGKSLSIDVLPQQNDKFYYYIFNIPLLPKKNIQLFRITNEPKEGSVLPLGQTLLFGKFVE